jgi:hypothetical protein
MKNDVMGTPAEQAKQQSGQTVRVKFYKHGLLEGWFVEKYQGTENPILKKVYEAGAITCKVTRDFFARTANKIKSIRFTKHHLKFYAARMLVNLAFSAQGLIGLLSLGLFDPRITPRPSIVLARATKDLQIFNAGKVAEENEHLPEGERRAVPQHLAEAANRHKMSDDEIHDEMDRVIAEMKAKAETSK